MLRMVYLFPGDRIAALLLAGCRAAVCTVAAVKLELFAAPGVGSLCAVGASRVSATVILAHLIVVFLVAVVALLSSVGRALV
jgi:hypothetical protein